MANIRVDLNHAPLDGETITFKAPCNASSITGMVIYYPKGGGTVSEPFTLTDANGGDIGVLDNIFAKDAIVKAVLDTDGNKAFVQNPNTNTYLESRLDGKADKNHEHNAKEMIVSLCEATCDHISTITDYADLPYGPIEGVYSGLKTNDPFTETIPKRVWAMRLAGSSKDSSIIIAICVEGGSDAGTIRIGRHVQNILTWV